MADEPCQHCGRRPTAPVDLRAHTGMVVMARYALLSGFFCRECGMAMFRDRQNHTLIRGWWGVVAFFTNFYAVAKNVISWTRLVALPPPTGRADAPPLDPGRPLFARLGVWVVVALFLAGNVVLDSGDPPNPDLAGTCVNLGRDGMQRVDCDEIHDGMILNLTTSAESCAAGSDHALKLRRPEPSIACVDLDR